MEKDNDVVGAAWNRGAWRGSAAHQRSDNALVGREDIRAGRTSGENRSATGSEGVEERPPLLVMFNPACAHDRTSWDIMNCVECIAYSDAHWCDRIDLPGRD